MTKTVIGIFDDVSDAQKVVRELEDSGVQREDIQIMANEGREEYTASQTENESDTGSGSAIGNFFRSLFGGDEPQEDAGSYQEAVRRGGTLVTVNASNDEMVERVTDIMEDNNAVDVDERALQWHETGWTGYGSNAEVGTENATTRERETTRTGLSSQGEAADLSNKGDVTLPVVEEELQIGKRKVGRGGVRVYSRMTEKPVEEDVQLREEHVKVERRPVDRPVTDADFDTFKEGTIEVTETAEEPVIAKRARVVEEVVVRKDVEDRTETVRDSVRRTDVDVEQIESEKLRDNGSVRGTDADVEQLESETYRGKK